MCGPIGDQPKVDAANTELSLVGHDSQLRDAYRLEPGFSN